MTPPIPSSLSVSASARPVARAVRVSPARRGFTLIEMMVVISILLVLMGIVSVGLYSLIGGNQRKQTETILKRAQAFTAEINNAKQSRDAFYQRVLWTTYGTVPSPTSTNGSTAAGTTASTNDTLQIAAYLLSFKPNRDAALKLAPRNLGELSPIVRPAFNITDGQLIANMLVDAWGNPVIFVPDAYEYLNPTTNVPQPAAGAGGLTGVYSVAGNSYWDATRPSAAPTGATQTDNRLRAPDRRPFWFSAGPDGNYATHDDNVYSFN